MAIPSYDYLSEPLIGDDLDYDFDESMYIPKVEFISKYFYVDLIKDWTTTNNAQAYLHLLARVVYTVIMGMKDQKWREYVLYYLSHSKSARIELMKIFGDSVWYNRRDGGFMMAYNSGANLNQGKLIEFGIDKALSPIAKQLMMNSPLGIRVFNLDFNDKTIYTSLANLLNALEGGGYITSDEADVVTASEDINDLPSNETYQVLKVSDTKYVFTDLTSFKTAIQNRRIYNPTTGTW